MQDVTNMVQGLLYTKNSEYQVGTNSLKRIFMQNKSILVVDDEQSILHSLSRELTCTGVKVTTATNGEEAITKINNGSFDLVTTELLMPGLDGFHVVKAAKENNLQTMVIILTGCGAVESAINALRLGADDFLQKPCETDELLYRISNCFVKQEMLRKIAWYENCLPVCCYCKKIREERQGMHDKGKWYSPDEYFSKTKGVSVSHGCCPDCFAEQIKMPLPV